MTLNNPDGNTPGTWAWVDDTQSVGNIVSPAATFKANFTPTDATNYNTVENVEVTVTVSKANPTANAPTASATYGQTLADVKLNNPTGNTEGTWAWVDVGSTSVGEAGDHVFRANFTPTDATNYNTVENVEVAVTVGKANPTATATYGQPLSEVTLTNPEGNTSGTWAWADEYNPNITPVGIDGVNTFRANFTPTDTTNYNTVENVDVAVTVEKAELTLQIICNPCTYGEHLDASVTYNTDYDGAVTLTFYRIDGTTKTTEEDGAETVGGPPTNAGYYTIEANATGSDNYKSRTQTSQVCIKQAPNTAVIQPAVTIQRDKSYDLSQLVSGAKGTVSFALVGAPQGYSLSGENNKTLTLTNDTAASCEITATADGKVDGKSNYEPLSRQITVTAKDKPTQDGFGFDDVTQEKTYGDGDFTVTATGAVTGSSVTYAVTECADVAQVDRETGKVTIKKVGRATITATAGETEDYAEATACCWLTVNQKPVTVSGITANDKTYNGTTEVKLNTTGAVIHGKLEQDDLTLNARGWFENMNAGVNKTVEISYTLDGASAGNYMLAESGRQTSTQATIHAKTVTVSVSSITANDKTYDGTTEVTLNTTGVVLNGVLDEDLQYNALTVAVSGAFNDPNAGVNKTVNIFYTLGGASAGNYMLAESGQPTSTQATIRAKTVSVSGITAEDKSYDGTTAAPLNYTGATFDGICEGDALTVTATGTFDNPNVGEGKAVTISNLTLGGAQAGNYALAENGQQTTATATINKAPLTVTANPRTITYGNAPANDGVTCSGFVNNETEGVLGVTLDYDYSYAQYGNVGSTYTITPKGLTSGNYEISFAPGTLSVAQKEAGLTWSNTPLTFNGLPQAPTATATGTVNNDAISVTVSGGQTNAGTGYTATASGLTGEKAGNYKLPDAKTTHFSIDKAAAQKIDDVIKTKYLP